MSAVFFCWRVSISVILPFKNTLNCKASALNACFCLVWMTFAWLNGDSDESEIPYSGQYGLALRFFLPKRCKSLRLSCTNAWIVKRSFLCYTRKCSVKQCIDVVWENVLIHTKIYKSGYPVGSLKVPKMERAGPKRGFRSPLGH